MKVQIEYSTLSNGHYTFQSCLLIRVIGDEFIHEVNFIVTKKVQKQLPLKEQLSSSSILQKAKVCYFVHNGGEDKPSRERSNII